MKNKEFFKIPIELYFADLYISINQSDRKFRNCLLRSIPKEDALSISKLSNGEADAWFLNSGNNYAIRFLNYTDGDISLVSHEIFHATLQILKDRGIRICSKSEEAYAYLNGLLMQKFYELI